MLVCLIPVVGSPGCARCVAALLPNLLCRFAASCAFMQAGTPPSTISFDTVLITNPRPARPAYGPSSWRLW